MHIRNKFLSLILAVVILGVFLPVAYAVDTEEDSLNYKQQLVVNMGFMSEEMLAKEQLTRGEMAGIAAVFYEKKFKNIYEEQNPFLDVLSNNENYQAIMALLANGAISVSEDKCFRPDDYITCDEAAKIFINIIGRGYLAELNGGFPGGYKATAISCELECIYTNSGYISGAAAANTIYKALQKNMDYEPISSVNSETRNYETVLKYYFNAYQDEGIVTGGWMSQLGPEKNVTENQVEIEYEKYLLNDKSILDYIGYNVKYYYFEDDNGGYVLWAYALKDNNSIRILSEDIDGFVPEQRILKYNIDSAKKVKISSSAYVLYNGEYQHDYEYDVFDRDRYDAVTIIDNNDDDEYDVIIFEKSEGIIVSGADEDRKIIYSQTSKNIELSKSNVYYIISDENGTQMSFEDIRQGDMFNVYASENTVKLIRSDNSVSGTIKSISDSGYYTVIRVGTHEIKVKPNCHIEKKLAVGEKVRVYFDSDNLAAIIMSDDEKKNLDFGYVINVWQNEGETDKAYMKLFNTEGYLVTLGFALKCSIDGYGAINPEEAVKTLKPDGVIKNRVIYYTLNNDGYISKIDTMEEDKIPSQYGVYQLVSKQKLKYKRNARTFSALANISGNTVIMNIPDDISSASDRDFYLSAMSGFVNDGEYIVEAYTLEKREPVANLLLVYNSKDISISTTSNEVVIEKIIKTINNEGEAADCIQGYSQNGEFEAIIAESFGSIKNYKVGDIVLAECNNFGEIVAMRKLFDYEKTRLMGDDGKTAATNPTAEKFDNIRRWAYGNAYYISNNVLRLHISYDDIPEGIDVKLENHYLPLFRIVKFDEENKKVSPASQNDILDYLTKGTASKVFISTGYGDGRFMVVYE